LKGGRKMKKEIYGFFLWIGKMKKEIYGFFLWILGFIGFFLLYGGVGGIEVNTMSLVSGIITIIIGLIILVAVVFWGIPSYDGIRSQKEL